MNYPQRRAYPWAKSTVQLDLDGWLTLFKKMRGTARGANPNRFAAIHAVMGALEQLSHTRGIDTFRGDKVHALLCAAADEHGWNTHPGTFKKRDTVSHSDDPPGMRTCPECGELHPIAAFQRPKTPAELARTKRLKKRDKPMTQRTCKDCRDAYKSKQARAAVAVRKLTAKRQLHAGNLTYSTLWQAVADVRKASENALRRKQLPSAAAFYRMRVHVCKQALDYLDGMSNGGTLQAFIDNHEGAKDWKILLDEDQQRDLFDAWSAIRDEVRAEGKRQRLPSY